MPTPTNCQGDLSTSEMDTCGAFYFYRLPGERQVHSAMDCAVDEVESLISLQGRDTFIISDFDGRKLALLPNQSDHLDQLDQSDQLPTPKEEYMAGAQAIIADLRKHPERKVVYSRIVVAPRDFESIAGHFSALCERYPHAFVYCYNTPLTGLWMGASPELLCEHHDGTVRTMALAGTKRIGDTSPWDTKNIEEQAFVARFIASQFADLGIEVTQSQTDTMEAGPVKHLCTRFVSTGRVSLSPAMRLPEILSPTPALCGTPRSYAMQMIHTYERHSRGCYGGFSGPMTAHGDYVFWVNLRCMKIAADHVELYVGGGLTHLSDPADEWEETAAKALTLINP